MKDDCLQKYDFPMHRKQGKVLCLVSALQKANLPDCRGCYMGQLAGESFWDNINNIYIHNIKAKEV